VKAVGSTWKCGKLSLGTPQPIPIEYPNPQLCFWLCWVLIHTVFDSAHILNVSFIILKMRINGNFRILKWRYCTTCLAIFCWDIMAIDEKLPEDAGLMEMPNTWLAHGLTTGNTHLVNLGFPKW